MLKQRKPMNPGKGFKPKGAPRREYDPDRVRSTPTPTAAFRQAARVEGHAAPIEKKNAIECEPYRRLVAALPCIHCGRTDRSQAAHPPPEGKGIKEDDRMCFPLCAQAPGEHGCHYLFDQYLLLPRDDMRPAAAIWAEATRRTIREIGLWPKNLPRWEADHAV